MKAQKDWECGGPSHCSQRSTEVTSQCCSGTSLGTSPAACVEPAVSQAVLVWLAALLLLPEPGPEAGRPGARGLVRVSPGRRVERPFRRHCARSHQPHP